MVLDRPGVLHDPNARLRHARVPAPGQLAAGLRATHGLGTVRLTAAGAAEACGCTLATAKIRIHRARTRLRDALNAQCEFYRDGENVFRCDLKSHDSS
jgi:RNA polymerase sigma-70 factor (ECF subfamily)